MRYDFSMVNFYKRKICDYRICIAHCRLNEDIIMYRIEYNK